MSQIIYVHKKRQADSVNFERNFNFFVLILVMF